MKYSIRLHTASRLSFERWEPSIKSFEPKEGQTVEELADTLLHEINTSFLEDHPARRVPQYTDYIVIQLVKPQEEQS